MLLRAERSGPLAKRGVGIPTKAWVDTNMIDCKNIELRVWALFNSFFPTPDLQNASPARLSFPAGDNADPCDVPAEQISWLVDLRYSLFVACDCLFPIFPVTRSFFNLRSSVSGILTAACTDLPSLRSCLAHFIVLLDQALDSGGIAPRSHSLSCACLSSVAAIQTRCPYKPSLTFS